MRYGLQAEPRKPAGFAAPEYGTFVHYVLEHVLQNSAAALDAPRWGEGERNALTDAVDQAVERYVRENLGGLDQQSDRFQYLFQRLLRPCLLYTSTIAINEITPADWENIRDNEIPKKMDSIMILSGEKKYQKD